MASYLELHDLLTDKALRERCLVAVLVEADEIRRDASATAGQKALARSIFGGPQAYSEIALRAVLANYNTVTVAQITQSTDTMLQNAVHDVMPLLAGE